MKKFSFLSALAVFALAVCGCSKDAAQDAAAPQGVQVSFRGEYTPAADAGKQSRVSVDPATGKTSWTATDRCGIWVLENSDSNVPFTNTAEHPELFTGTLDAGITSSDPVWGYYPYDTNASLQNDGRQIVLTLPSAQVQQGGQMGSYSILTAAGTLTQDAEGNPQLSAMHFIHQTAGICFNIYGSLRAVSYNPETLQSVSFTVNNEVRTSLTITDPGTPAAVTAGTGQKTISVTLENAPGTIGYAKTTGTKAFVSVLCAPCDITSIVVTTDQGVYTKDFTSLPNGYKRLDPQAGKIYPVNLDLGTFAVKKRFDLGVPGDHNGWNTSEGITGRTDGFFSGMVSFAGNYKYNNGSWWGYGGEPYTLYYTLSESGGNFTITGDYYCVVDMPGKTASLIGSIHLPGTWNSFDPASAPTFTYDEGRDLWVLKNQTMNTGNEFKVVFNGTWADNMNRTIVGGGTLSAGTPVRLGFDASNNIIAGESGTYDVTLDLSTYGGTLAIEPVAVP